MDRTTMARRINSGAPALLVVLLASCATTAISIRSPGAVVRHTPIATEAASSTAPVKKSGPASPTAMPPAANWMIGRRIHVPGAGMILYGDGSLWVVDVADRGFTKDIPNGDIYRIDPVTGRTIAKIGHARGGFPAAGEGAAWFINAEFGETVTRVDFKTNVATRFRTSATEDPAPEALAIAQGAIWVGNNHDGTVVKVDPRTRRVVATIHLVGPDLGGVRGQATTDGTSVWFPIDPTLEIARIDAASATEVSRIRLPLVAHDDTPPGWDASPEDMSKPEELAVLDRRLYASTAGHVYVIDVSRIGGEKIVGDIPIEGLFAPVLRAADGAIWALTPDPAVLMRIDPATARVTERFPIDERTNAIGLGPTIAVVGDSVWVRVPGQVLEVRVP